MVQYLDYGLKPNIRKLNTNLSGFKAPPYLTSKFLIIFIQRLTRNPSQESSVGSISAWYRRGPGFKSRQGQKLLILTKKELLIQI